MQLDSILKAVKEHGVLSVILVGMFLYFQTQINDLTSKYETCMNERINDAYRVRQISRKITDEQKDTPRLIAILPDQITIKKKEA